MSDQLKVTVYLPTTLVQRIDLQLDGRSRSTWIARVIADELALIEDDPDDEVQH